MSNNQVPGLSPNGTHFVSGKALAAGSLERSHGFAEPAASAVRLTKAKVSAIWLSPNGSLSGNTFADVQTLANYVGLTAFSTEPSSGCSSYFASGKD